MNNKPTEADLQIFFDSNPFLLAKIDRDGNFISVNDVWLGQFNLSVDDIKEQNIFSIIRDPKIESIQNKFKNHLFEGIPVTIEIEMVGRTEHKVIEVVCALRGSHIYLFGNDVTKRVIGDKILEEQRMSLEFRQIFEDTLTNISTRMINLGIDELDAAINEILQKIGRLMGVDRSYVFLFDEGNTTMSNTHEWCETGITPEIENLKDLPIDIFPWWIAKLRNFEVVNVPFVSKLPAEAAAEKEILEMQDIKSVMVVPIKRHKELVGFAGFDAVKKQRDWSFDSISLMRIVGDILSNALTRIYYEGVLRESDKRSKELLRSLPDVMLTIDAAGNLLSFQPSIDPSLNEVFEVYEKNPLKLFTTQVDHEKILDAVKNTLENGSLNKETFTLETDEISRVLELRSMRVDKETAMVMIRDISEQVRLEEMKSDFINKATHELRSPVATMLLMVNLLESAETEQKKEEYWQVLKGELNKEKLLIDDLLTAGRLESQQQKFNYKPIDLGEFIREIISKSQIQANDKQITVRLTMHSAKADANWNIVSDETSLNQIFVNLINNAIKFTDANGKVNVDVSSDDENFLIKVKDTGIGIPAEDLPFLFSRFFRGRNAVQQQIQGTGIGLFIVKTLVEAIGGNIKVESMINSGTTFTVTLPKDPTKKA